MKSQAIIHILDELAPQGYVQPMREQCCTWCGSAASYFRDGLSQREYRISGFCQECQDKTFGNDDI